MVILYLAQFSITTASFVLSSYAGCAIAIKVLENLIRHRRIFFGFGAFEILLVWIVGLWIIAAIFDLGSGRAQYCGDFNILGGISYSLKSFTVIKKAFVWYFWISFIAVAICAIYDIYHKRDTPLARFFFISILYLTVMTIFFTLVVSKCGAKYYLMSGLFMAMFFIQSIWIALLCARSNIAVFFSALLLIIIFLVRFEAYKERPRNAYNFYKSHSQHWIDEMKKAESLGQSEVVIAIPREFGHWKWEVWFPPAFSHTLYVYGLIPREINVKFIPQDEIDSRQTQH